MKEEEQNPSTFYSLSHFNSKALDAKASPYNYQNYLAACQGYNKLLNSIGDRYETVIIYTYNKNKILRFYRFSTSSIYDNNNNNNNKVERQGWSCESFN